MIGYFLDDLRYWWAQRPSFADARRRWKRRDQPGTIMWGGVCDADRELLKQMRESREI